jgi:hypothetical protein
MPRNMSDEEQRDHGNTQHVTDNTKEKIITPTATDVDRKIK